jgi:hypothetical protein
LGCAAVLIKSVEACQDFFVGNFYADVQEGETRLQRMDANGLNDEARMTNEARMLKCPRNPVQFVGHSGLVVPSSLDIRHLSFLLRPRQ